MKRYRSKPSEIEATEPVPKHITDDVLGELAEFAPGKIQLNGDVVVLLAGKDGAQEWVPVPAGHRLVRVPGDPSDVWPVEAGYFDAKYEPVEATTFGGTHPYSDWVDGDPNVLDIEARTGRMSIRNPALQTLPKVDAWRAARGFGKSTFDEERTEMTDRTYLYGFEDDEYLEYDVHEALEKRWDECEDPALLVGKELCAHVAVPPSQYLSLAEYLAEMIAERADGDMMAEAYEEWFDALKAPEAIAIIEEMRTKLAGVVDRKVGFRMAGAIVRRLPIGQTEDGKYLTLDGEPTNFEIHP